MALAFGLLLCSAARAQQVAGDPGLQETLRALEARVEALTERIAELEGERDAARAGNATPQVLTAPAAPSDTNTERHPQDATSVPGTVAIGPGVPAWPVASGGQTARVTLSGQLNRALLWGDDGLTSKLRNVDNNQSSTRLRIFAVGQLDANTFVGGQVETELRSNSSARIHLQDDGPNSSESSTFTERQIEAIVYSKVYGRLRIGQGSTASDESTQADLADTGIIGGVQVSDFDGGFQFRTRDSNQAGPAVGSVFNYFAGLGRDDRIRYDTPSWRGFSFAASAVDGGAWDMALRYAGQTGRVRLIAALAYADATSRDNPLPAVTALDSRQISGSLSLLVRPLGLSVTVAAGTRDVDYMDSNGADLDPGLWYGKLGWQGRLVEFGATALSLDFAQNRSLSFDGDVARAYGFQAVQHIDRIGTDLYFGFRHQTLDRRGAQFEPLNAFMSGMRVRF